MLLNPNPYQRRCNLHGGGAGQATRRMGAGDGHDAGSSQR